MSRSIRGDNRAKRLSGRVAHDQKLARASKRNSVLTDIADSCKHAINKTGAICYTN